MESPSDDKVLCVIEAIKSEANTEEETLNIKTEDSSNSTQSTNIGHLKAIFDKRLIDYDNNNSALKRFTQKPWTRKRIADVIAELKRNKMIPGINVKPINYYWVNNFQVAVTSTNEEYLIVKKKKPEDLILRVVPREEYYDVLREIDIETGHGDLDKFISAIKTKYYIPKKAIELYVSIDPERLPKGCDSKCDSYNHSNHKGILSLIDFQSFPDGQYKWLLIYQHDVTKFVSIRPLQTDSTKEISTELLKIILSLGIPVALKSNLKVNFVLKILDELSKLWPDCRLEVEMTKKDESKSKQIEKILRDWMNRNNCTNWSTKCFFVEYYLNTYCNDNLECKPYEALFGRTPKIDFKEFSIPDKTYANNENTKQVNIIKSELVTKTSEFNSTEVQNCFSSDQDIINDDAFKCKSCTSNVIVICGIIDDSEGQRLNVTCYKCRTVQDMTIARKKAQKRVIGCDLELLTPKKAAYCMKKGQSVAVSIPKALRGPMNLETIKGKIVDIQNEVFRIATRTGTIKNWFSEEDLEPIADCGVVSDTLVSLEDAVLRLKSVTTNLQKQAIKCQCKPAVNQCQSKRCICFRAQNLCGPECHQQSPCVNT